VLVNPSNPRYPSMRAMPMKVVSLSSLSAAALLLVPAAPPMKKSKHPAITSAALT